MVASFVRKHWDMVALFVLFAVLLVRALEFPERGRYFPVLFAALGLVLIGIQSAAYLAPEPYTRRFLAVTSGLTSESNTERLLERQSAEDDVDSGEVEGAAEAPTGVGRADAPRSESRRRLAVMLGLLVTFVVLAYAVGFLVAIPVYTFLSIYLLGSGSLLRAAILAATLMVAIYLLFGILLSVPILEGSL